MEISTPRLSLLDCNEEIFLALLKSNETLGQLLDIEVPENWSSFGLEPYAWALTQLRKDREHANWLVYLVIQKDDQKMIGTCGYKGKPNGEGMVEIGYEIIPDYRLQGYATEAALALINHAFQFPGIQKVQAHTLAEENPSTSILKKCGMEFVQEVNDPEDGDIWQWCKKSKELIKLLASF